MLASRMLGILVVLAASGCAPATTSPSATPEHESREVEPDPAAGPQLDDDLQQIPGTRVRMRVPPDALQPNGFLGLTWAEGASIVIIEIPGPYAEATAGFTTDNLASAGMSLVDAQPLTVSGYEGQLLELRQEAEGVRYHKWLLACGDDSSTLIVNAIFDEALAEQFADPLRAALLSVTWDPQASVDPLAELDWTIDAPAGLRPFEFGAAMFGFNEAGDPDWDPGAPLYIAAPSFVQVGITDADAQAQAEAAIRTLAQVRELEFELSQPFELPGVAAWEIVGRAKDPDSDLELLVHQVLLVREGGYVRMVGIVRASDAELWLPRFRAAARSWSPKSASGQDAEPGAL